MPTVALSFARLFDPVTPLVPRANADRGGDSSSIALLGLLRNEGGTTKPEIGSRESVSPLLDQITVSGHSACSREEEGGMAGIAGVSALVM